MKYLNVFMLTMFMVKSAAFAKENDQLKNQNNIKKIAQNDARPKSKKIRASISPDPKVAMYVTVDNDKTHKADKFIITPSMKSLQIEIFDPNLNNFTNETLDKVYFSINPCILVDYLNQPKETRKHYNFHNELDRPGQQGNGEERLMQALAASVEFSYENLTSSIVLPNPMVILHDLLGCNC